MPKRAGSRVAALSKGMVRQRGKMNRTETAYSQHLEVLRLAGEIVWWRFEPLTLRLTHPDAGQPITYTPDFVILYPDGRTYMDDIKPPRKQADDPAAKNRIKLAAEVYSLWEFRIVRRQGSNWTIEVMG